MKKNMLPLVGIAFVVAVISTAVFYGLFAGKLSSKVTAAAGQPVVVAARQLERGAVLQAADLKLSMVGGDTVIPGSLASPEKAVGRTLAYKLQPGEPVTQAGLGLGKPGAGKANGETSSEVPAGMRAVSLRVSESSGIVGLLRPGAKVDVQAVLPREGAAELRAILQNAEVLAVSGVSEAPHGSRDPVPVVTVLARPQDADAIALADSTARIRIALRNPLDNDGAPRRALALASLFQSASVSQPVSQPPAERAFKVEWLGVSPAALSELRSQLNRAPTNESPQVALFRAGVDAPALLRKLAEKHEIEPVSPSRNSACRFRVRFSPGRIEPELTWKRPSGVETRRFDAEAPTHGSYLVSGLLAGRKDAAELEQMFPGHNWTDRELLIVVTPAPRGQ
jgi:pilus assembly protein CpaB